MRQRPLFGMCASRGEMSAEEARRPSLPFHRTNRWLRGRLVATFTGAPEGAWLPLPDQVGTHDGAAIAAAVESLEREGFLELRDGQARLRP